MPNEDLEAFLTGGKPAEQAPEPAPEPEPVAAEAQPVEDAAPAQSDGDHDDDEGISPDIEDPKFRRALSAMRRDHKGQAERLRGELEAIKAQAERDRLELENLRKTAAQAPQPPAQPAPPAMPDIPEDPVERRLLNAEVNLSERYARRRYKDFDEKQKVFLQAAELNPALRAQALQQEDPWGWAYEQAEKLTLANKVMADPTAYETEMKARLRAEWEAEQAAKAPPPAPQINPAAGITTPSLGSARGSAPRSAPAYSGPLSVEQLFP